MATTLKVWSGSAWVAKPAKAWSGSAWAAKPVKVWSGSAWISSATGGPPYLDSFDRANANLEASLVASGGWSWTHDGVIAAGFTIVSNALKSNTALTTGSAYKTPALASADHYVQYKVTNITSATGPFICCRLADASNFIGIRTGNGGSNGQIEVYRRVSGSLSSLYVSAASAVAVNDIVKLAVSGSTFTVTKNGGAVTGPTAIGATLTATNAGLVARSSTTMTIEDFEAG